MPTCVRTGRTKKHRVGYMAYGYSKDYDFWYASEGVFATEKLAIEDLNRWYYPIVPHTIRVIKVPLKRGPV